jgi:hypothetical protein
MKNFISFAARLPKTQWRIDERYRAATISALSCYL